MKQKRRHKPPGPIWSTYMEQSRKRISAADAWRAVDPVQQIAEEIVRHGTAFLKSVRRGRSTQRQNLRYQLLRVVEQLVGAGVPRRREDRNTPEAMRPPVRLELDTR